ncbi:MAG: Fumarate hydratase class II [Methanoregula sp. PtaU1.Bin051]|nr:MAG: Fumarate hydratase class II [Methanoregula sp. PtaU1.Bin051]
MRKDVVRHGRLSGERSGAMMKYLSSMPADRYIADADILVDIAHVLMLSEQKIIDRAIAQQLMSALLEMHDEGIPDEVFDDRFEDVHAGIESLLVEACGADCGGRLHIGRSRNDEVATCIRIRLREDILHQMGGLLRLREVLAGIAAQHTETAMPGFTHLQHAQPTTPAHHMLAYEQAFSRDFDRLRDAYVRVNLCPLGAAAFASTGYPIDRKFTADLLGFDGLMTNTMDAAATRDFALEVLADCTISMTNISRLCEELVLWSSSFVRFVHLDDAFCSTSSIMPQKKNPDVAEIMRAKTGSVLGSLAAAMTIVKGLPMSYNRDLQELTPHLWRGMGDAKESVDLLTTMLASATFDTERMAEEAGKGFSTATDLADALVRAYDIPFRTAHSIVGRAVQKGSLTVAALDAAAEEVGAGFSLRGKGLTQAQVDKALSVAGSLSLRKAPGGPAPVATRKALAGRKKQLDADSALLDAWCAKVAKAEKRLIGAARRLVS